jgi:hypothetical protein
VIPLQALAGRNPLVLQVFTQSPESIIGSDISTAGPGVPVVGERASGRRRRRDRDTQLRYDYPDLPPMLYPLRIPTVATRAPLRRWRADEPSPDHDDFQPDSHPDRPPLHYGHSCKLRSQVSRFEPCQGSRICAVQAWFWIGPAPTANQDGTRS